MKTHIESVNAISKKVTITFDEAICKDVRLTVLKKAQKEAVLPGFRKGKVPLEMLEKRYAEGLLQEFRQELASKALEHLKKSDKLEVVAIVKSDFSDKDKGQMLELEVELAPEIILPNYKDFRLDKEDFRVTEVEVNDFIERLQKQQASYEVVEREAQSKDYVKLSYEGFIDDISIDSYQGLPHLWAKQKMTWEEVDAKETPGIPEIVKGIKGLKAGDKKEIKVKLPSDFSVKELQNKKAIYKVEILEVREVKLPDLNEEFFKKLQVKDKAELDAFAQKTLSNRKEQEYASQQKQRISEFLIQSVNCELPSSWIQSETNKVLQEMINLFSSHGIKQGTLEEQKESLIERASAVARDRIKLNLCFEKIFNEEKLKMEARDIELVLVQEAAQQHITPQKLLQIVQKDERERNAIQNKAFQAKMINWLFNTLRENSKK